VKKYGEILKYKCNQLLFRRPYKNWLKGLQFVRTSFCKNLHAKCYINEEKCIVTSLNLYEFSQVNNNEMGVLIYRHEDPELYRDAFDEAQRIIRVSDEVRMTLENVVDVNSKNADIADSDADNEKLSTSKLARRLKISTQELLEILIQKGFLTPSIGIPEHSLTDLGVSVGGELKVSKRFGSYFIWPSELTV
jgi:phosphatidylserine/phosphatidylglycerophosphate/cardiolipin synthase-like enzyme